MSLLSKVIKKINLELMLAKNRNRSERDAVDSGLVQWGIVGTGYMAETFAEVIDGSESSNLLSVSSRSEAKGRAFARRHGAASWYSSICEFAEKESHRLDVVYIATPLEAHFDNAVECLSRGLNVICEKPLCWTERESAELYLLAEKNGVKLIEAMWSWCLPTYKAASRWIDAGRIGVIESVEVVLCKNEPHPNRSVMFDYGTYALAFVEKFVGDVFQFESVETDRYSQTDLDCDWRVIGIAECGARVSIRISATEAAPSSAVIVGAKGAIKFSPQFNRTNKVCLFDQDGLLVEDCEYGYRCQGYEYQLDDVCLLLAGQEDCVGFSSVLSVATAGLRDRLLCEGGY